MEEWLTSLKPTKQDVSVKWPKHNDYLGGGC